MTTILILKSENYLHLTTIWMNAGNLLSRAQRILHSVINEKKWNWKMNGASDMRQRRRTMQIGEMFYVWHFSISNEDSFQ